MLTNVQIVMTLLVRDEADIVAAVVEHHLAAGVDLIVATDNGSVDGTEEILRAYADANVVELHHEPALDYRQSEWVTRMARRAAAVHGATWVLNADADEFFWPPSLPAALGDVTDGSVVVRRDNLVADPTASGAWPHRLVLRDPLSLSPRGTRIGPKLAHPGDPDVTVAAGNHAATGPLVGAVSARQPLQILHAPDRGFAQYERKIRNGGSAYAVNTVVGQEVGWHWREDYDRLRDGTLAATYAARQRSLDDVERQLATGDLVRDTRLRDRLTSLVPDAVLPELLAKVLG
jgi:hypothetical protein